MQSTASASAGSYRARQVTLSRNEWRRSRVAPSSSAKTAWRHIRAKFSAINAAGGIQGRKLRLLTADDQFEPSKTIPAYDSLASQGIVAFVGNFGTPTTLKALPWIARHRIPVVGVYSGAQAIRSPVNPDIFNLRGSLLDEAAAIRQLLEPQGISRIAVLYESDAYGQAGLQAIQATYDGDVPSAPLDVGASAAQVQSAVAKILHAKPQVIVLVLTTKIAIAAVRAIHAAGFHGVRQQIVALSGVGPGAFAAGLPRADRAGVLVSTIVPFPWMNGFIARSLTLDYKADMDAAQANDAVGFSSMEGYIDASVLVRGLMAAKAIHPGSIAESLNGLGSFDLGGYAWIQTGISSNSTCRGKAWTYPLDGSRDCSASQVANAKAPLTWTPSCLRCFAPTSEQRWFSANPVLPG